MSIPLRAKFCILLLIGLLVLFMPRTAGADSLDAWRPCPDPIVRTLIPSA